MQRRILRALGIFVASSASLMAVDRSFRVWDRVTKRSPNPNPRELTTKGCRVPSSSSSAAPTNAIGASPEISTIFLFLRKKNVNRTNVLKLVP